MKRRKNGELTSIKAKALDDEGTKVGGTTVDNGLAERNHEHKVRLIVEDGLEHLTRLECLVLDTGLVVTKTLDGQLPLAVSQLEEPATYRRRLCHRVVGQDQDNDGTPERAESANNQKLVAPRCQVTADLAGRGDHQGQHQVRRPCTRGQS